MNARARKAAEAAAKIEAELKAKMETARILEDQRQEALALAEIDHQIALPHSVVKASYKTKYKERAIAAGLKGKAPKRSNGDWLSRQMAELVLDKKEKLVVERLVEVCAANGLDGILERWPNQSKGWEGRLRMTACLVLRKIVADNASLIVPGQEDRIPPADFIRLNETR
jgi:hypothetical protein